MFTELDDFLATGVPSLVTGTSRLHALFATYHEVAGYKTGYVPTRKPGLTIQVQNGGLKYSSVAKLVHSPDRDISTLGGNMMDLEASLAQFAVKANLEIRLQEGVPLVALIYAGLTAFDEAAVMARQIKMAVPASRVIVTTCDCNLKHKRDILRPILDSGEIDMAVVTWMCGGNAMMAMILEAVIEAWPASVFM